MESESSERFCQSACDEIDSRTVRYKLSILALVAFAFYGYASVHAQERKRPRTVPTKTKSQIAVEKEVPILQHLSASDKAILRDGVRTMDRVIRLTLLNGFTTDVDKEYDADGIITKMQRAVDVAAKRLPKSVFSGTLNVASRAWIDAHMAYVKAQRKADDSFLSLMDEYGLRNIPPERAASEILNIGRINVNMAIEMCRRAGIL